MLSRTGSNYVPNCDEDKEQHDSSENSNKTDSNNDRHYQPDMLLECNLNRWNDFTRASTFSNRTQ